YSCSAISHYLLSFSFFFLLTRLPPISTFFPYTTLFRSYFAISFLNSLNIRLCHIFHIYKIPCLFPVTKDPYVFSIKNLFYKSGYHPPFPFRTLSCNVYIGILYICNRYLI